MPIDLLTSPRSRAEDLGLPMPDDAHAVSACLPLWSHNVGYEEGEAAIIEKLQAAYPRFCLHPLVRQLASTLTTDTASCGLPFASRRCARRAAEYARRHNCPRSTLVDFPGWQACGVVVPAESYGVLKQYWQHAGEVVSSRVAERILGRQPAPSTMTAARRTVRERIAELHETTADKVFLFPSGMAAVAAAWRTARRRHPQAPGCQFGFPYVDTLKIQQRFTDAPCLFYPVGSAEDLDSLAQAASGRTLSAIFCEVPTNPLLQTPDVDRLRTIADAADALLVIDDTLTACGNLKLLPHADIVVTSLTKYFSGYGNVLAGALVLNPQSRIFAQSATTIADDFEETLSDPDVEVLELNSRDLSRRMKSINDNARRLAAMLKQHAAVDSVFYPDEQPGSLYDRLKSAGGGGGGLLSIVLKDAAQRTSVVFDALNVCKGPNLGTNFTLCCPYTVLAHYHELDFAEQCGVSRWLLRISVGTEPFADLQSRFAEALQAAG